MKNQKNPYLEMRDDLNKVGSGFCLAKWKQVSLHLQNGQTHSCHHPVTHQVRIEELETNPSALHNSRHKKLQRKLMLEGKRPNECNYCWNIEDSNSTNISDRMIKSSEDWAVPFKKEIGEAPWNANINPSYLEVSFSTTCNFKCSYCSAFVSSKWHEEIKRDGAYKNLFYGHAGFEITNRADRLPRFFQDDTPYSNAFFEWWPTLYPTLKVLRITGGEPLLSKHTFRVMDHLISTPNPDLEFCINTNLGVPEALITRMIESLKTIVQRRSIKRVSIYTSLDTWGDQAAYIRYGLDFPAFIKNVEKVLKELPEVQLVFMSTFNALSVSKYQDLLAFILDLKKRFYRKDAKLCPVILDIPNLTHPKHQSILVLTDEWKQKISNHYKFMQANEETRDQHFLGFSSYEIQKMKRIVDWCEVTSMADKDLRMARSDFYSFFSQHDKKRNISFLKVFPEMKDFWDLCHTEYKSFGPSPGHHEEARQKKRWTL